MSEHEWLERFKTKFTEIMGEFVPVCYDTLAKECLASYGIGVSPEKAAESDAANYD